MTTCHHSREGGDGKGWSSGRGGAGCGPGQPSQLTWKTLRGGRGSTDVQDCWLPVIGCFSHVEELYWCCYYSSTRTRCRKKFSWTRAIPHHHLQHVVPKLLRARCKYVTCALSWVALRLALCFPAQGLLTWWSPGLSQQRRGGASSRL